MLSRSIIQGMTEVLIRKMWGEMFTKSIFQSKEYDGDSDKTEHGGTC